MSFELADSKFEGDIIMHGNYHIVRNMSDTSGMYFVLDEDGQPVTCKKEGQDYFLLHPDKVFSVLRFKPSLLMRFIRYMRGLFNE